MKIIYEEAQAVYAWLGRPLGCPSHNEAIRRGKRMAEALLRYVQASQERGLHLNDVMASFALDSTKYSGTGDDIVAWEGIVELLNLRH